MNHYVYKVTSGWNFYIGVRSCKAPPQEDKYMGSGVWSLCAICYGKKEKHILSTHKTRLEAEIEESRLLKLHVGTLGCMNRKKSSPRSK